MYKRDIWEFSFDHETRILTKVIELQHTNLVYLSLQTSLSWILRDFSQIRSEVYAPLRKMTRLETSILKCNEAQ